MPSSEKVEKVAALKERIEGSSALLLAEYRGLTVAEIGELRRTLREADTSFAVVKNTLMQRAVADAGMEELTIFLSGPSAVAFVGGDPVTAAKAIKTAAKQFPSLVLKGGYMDGQVLDATGANALADLESREAMLSKIAGLLKMEMTRAAATFVGAQSKFLSLLEAYTQKVPGEDAEPAAEASEAPAAETTTEPSEATQAESPAEGASADEHADDASVADAPAESTEEE
jgi:large subunit ribosomal protein L10